MMAGTFVHLTFSNPANDLLRWMNSLQQFTQERMTFRSVAQLTAQEPVLGQTPAEWAAIGVTPGDLELEDDEWYFDVDERTCTSELSIKEALGAWPLGPWLGLAVEYDLPPGRDGYPGIYGSCLWRVWFADGGWCLSVSIDYPASSVRHNERWPGWLQQFVSAAKTTFDAECLASTP